MLLPSLHCPEDLNLIDKEGIARKDKLQVFFRQCKDGVACQNQLCIGVNKVEAGLVEAVCIVHL